MGARAFFVFSGVALLYLVSPAEAGPLVVPLKWTTTDGWKAQMPGDWRLARHKPYGPQKHLGRWRFESPHRNWELSIRVAPDAGEDYQKAAADNIERLKRRLDNQKVHQKDVTADGYVLLLQGDMVRKAQKHFYLVYRSMTRDTPNKLLYTLTLAATGERLDSFTALMKQISESFEPIAPAKQEQAAP